MIIFVGDKWHFCIIAKIIWTVMLYGYVALVYDF